MGSEYKHNNEEVGYRRYVEELKNKYNNNNSIILKAIEAEIIDEENSNEYIGINLLARQYFYLLSGQYENLIIGAEEAEKNLLRIKCMKSY